VTVHHRDRDRDRPSPVTVTVHHRDRDRFFVNFLSQSSKTIFCLKSKTLIKSLFSLAIYFKLYFKLMYDIED
jgi:hypothetical protein